MEESKLENDRCILFPRTEEAVKMMEDKVIDSRYEIDVIDLTFSNISKLRVFGFFDYTNYIVNEITNNCYVKIEPKHLDVVISAAVKARKSTNEATLQKLIDKIVEKTKRAYACGLPIWFNL